MDKMKLEKTRSGLPALWEKGGAGTNTGDSVIIADHRGEPPVATYIKTRGSLSCGEHALVIVKPGMFVVTANQHRSDFRIRIQRIVTIHGIGGEFEAEVELMTEFDQNEWVPLLPDFLSKATEAAKKKASDYHCRSVFFAKEKKPKEEPKPEVANEPAKP